MKILFSAILIFVLCIPAVSQEYAHNKINIEQLAEEMIVQQDLEINYEELYENLLQIYSSPLPLNTASEEEFRFLNILTEKQLQSLLTYRENQKRFVSVYELQAIENFDLNTIRRFAPFVQVIDKPLKTSLIKNVLNHQYSYLILRYDYPIQSKKGFTNDTDSTNQFQGSPDRLYTRFRSSKPGDYSIGFTLEKDTGEPLQWLPSRQYFLFDYTSFHIRFQNKGIIKNLVLGDFQGQFGQGLSLGGFFGFGKGGDPVTNTRRSAIGFIPYTSVNESSMLRGAGITLQTGKYFDFSLFFSRKRKDAVIAENNGETIITSLQTTGLHRNEKELGDRNMITETNYGAIVSMHHHKFQGGIIMNGTNFENSIKKKETIYNQHTFSGTDNINIDTYFSYAFQNANFFGEVAKSIHSGWAYMTGVLISMSDRFDISIVYRNYDVNFYSFYANAFGESGAPQNESGIYWGWKFSWNKKIVLSGYVDLFKFNWLRYRSYTPSSGNEWIIRLKYDPDKKSSYSFQLKSEQKIKNISGNGNLYRTTDATKQNAVLQANNVITKNLALKTRIQGSLYQFNRSRTTGFSIMEDVIWKFKRFEISGRYALFETSDYDNRQYTYERDAYLAYAMPSYFGKGIRTYWMVEYSMNKHISIWVRFSQTRYLNQDTVGSGLDTREGNQRNDLRVQLLLRP